MELYSFQREIASPPCSREWQRLVAMSARRDRISAAYAPVGDRLALEDEAHLLEAQLADIYEVCRLRGEAISADSAGRAQRAQ